MMMAEDTLRRILLERPEAVSLFEALGIDYACGGERTLREECQRKALSLDLVSQQVAALPAPEATCAEFVYLVPLPELARHIVETHHTFARTQMPRINRLFERAAQLHSSRLPNICRLREQMMDLSDEWSVHMIREERGLFSTVHRGGNPHEGGCRGVLAGCAMRVSLQQIRLEHQMVVLRMQSIVTALSHSLTVSSLTDPLPRELEAMLLQFQADLHLHVHLENNILLPRLEQLEQTLRA